MAQGRFPDKKIRYQNIRTLIPGLFILQILKIVLKDLLNYSENKVQSLKSLSNRFWNSLCKGLVFLVLVQLPYFFLITLSTCFDIFVSIACLFNLLVSISIASLCLSKGLNLLFVSSLFLILRAFLTSLNLII